jgi:AcrR family transcriptional regulator
MASTLPRTRRTADASRDHILSAAEQHVCEVGPMGFRLAEVARIAGVAHSNVLARFGSVEELQRQTALRFSKQIIADASAALSSDMNTEKPIHSFIQSLFRIFSDPARKPILAWMLMLQGGQDLSELDDAFGALKGLISARLEARGSPYANDMERIGNAVRLIVSVALGSAVADTYLNALAPGAESNDGLSALMSEAIIASLL